MLWLIAILLGLILLNVLIGREAIFKASAVLVGLVVGFGILAILGGAAIALVFWIASGG